MTRCIKLVHGRQWIVTTSPDASKSVKFIKFWRKFSNLTFHSNFFLFSIKFCLSKQHERPWSDSTELCSYGWHENILANPNQTIFRLYWWGQSYFQLISHHHCDCCRLWKFSSNSRLQLHRLDRFQSRQRETLLEISRQT